MSERRQSPDEVLHRVQEAERKEKHGRLKIYLGAAPGVGKTYTMLHDALEKRIHGLDVVVGVVVSHGREDIEHELSKFEIIPLQLVHYREKAWMELDVGAILQRQPGLILIDEMAHTNAPGLHHSKRWQDIKEILERGIDVYTTLNVQHIESLKDDVMQIVHAPILETVPDSMIEMADTLELVDLPPEELLKRLEDGKVYFPAQAEIAVGHFFRRGNLIALRELALRITVERVGADVLLYRQDEGIKQIWPTRRKILICVGPKPDSLKLIRAAKQMATSLHADWIAVYVDTPQLESSATNRNSAIQNLRLAEQLGAAVHVLTGFDIVKEVMNFAREQNVTQIMIRKRIATRWHGLFHRNLADELVRYSGEIDVYIMTSDSKGGSAKKKVKRRGNWKVYLVSISIVGMTTLLSIFLSPYIGASHLIMLYVISVMMIALFGRRGPSILASLLSVLIYDYLFLPPFNGFFLGHLDYTLILLSMLLIPQVICHLTSQIHRQKESSRINHLETRALYTLTRQLTTTRGVDKLLALGTRYIANVFSCDVMAMLPKKNKLDIRAYVSQDLKQHLDEKEQGIAQWVCEMGQAAGLGTDTLSFSNALYMPLLASRGCMGVLRIQPHSKLLFTPEQMGLLESCINQLALALEVDRLQEKERKKELEKETERARKLILKNISNDLSQPVEKVREASLELQKMEEEAVKVIGCQIGEEIEKLKRLNMNILQIIEKK